MTHYATCVGCVGEKACFIRDVFRLRIQGLGLTSVKWRCKSRIDRFQRGAPVWVVTQADLSNPTYDEDGREYGRGEGPERNTFPGIFIKTMGAKGLVFIHPGAQSMYEHVAFVGGPICKIPLSRMSARDGDLEEVCEYCDRPASAPHPKDYLCNMPKMGW